MQTSFLQSKDWAEFQRSLGREVFEYEKDGISAKIIKHDLSLGGFRAGPFGKNYLYIPHGPVMDFNRMIGGLKNPVANFVKWLRELGKKEKSIFIKAEPLVDNVAQALAEHRFKKSKKEIQPSRTVVIDLKQSENELLGRMHYKTRYNIKVAESHGIKVTKSHEVNLFLKLLKKTTKRDKFSPHPDNYYKKLLEFAGLDVQLFLAYKDDNPIAGAIILYHDNTVYYLHGASDYKYRSLMAPYALHWYIITNSQKLGVNNYNMWGIDAVKWPGVTRFKLGWGGHTVEYSGSFDLIIFQAWHLMYKIVSRIF